MAKSLFHKFLDLVFRHPLRLLGLFILLTALGLFGATRLSLSTSLSKLLPKDTPSVKTGNEVGARVGSTDFLVVAIEGPNPLRNREVADELARLMRKDMPELNEVMAKVDLEFFKDNGLLWFTKERIEAIDAQLKKVLGRAKLESMGLLVLPDGKDPEETRLEEMIRDTRLPASIPTELKSNQKRPEALKGYLASPDGKILAVVGRPGRVAVNMRYARRLVQSAEAVITKVRSKYPDKDLKIEVGGGYRNRVREYDSILRDMVSSFGLSFALIALLVVLFFRSLRPLPLIFLPLLAGLLATLGLTRAFGLAQLNIITAFIGGILLGMGIDFGVHLTARYLEERGRGQPLREALTTTMTSTGRALVTAAVTTAGALYLLFFSSFRGFWEFGLIAGTGVLVTLVFFLAFFPVMAVLLERFVEVKGSGFVPFTPGKDRGGIPRISLILFSGGIVVTVVLAVVGLPRLEFESNFRRLSGKPSTSIKYGKAMGDNASPTVALCATREDCTLFDAHLRTLLSTPLPNPDLRDYLALTTFIPEGQKEKLPVIRRMARRIKKAHSWADDKMKDRLKKIGKHIPAREVTVNDLPQWIRNRFTEKDGTMGRFLYLYPKRETWNAWEAALFKRHYGSFDLSRLEGAPKGAGVVRAASSSFILVDIIRIVKKEGVRIFLAALVLVFILLVIDLRRLMPAILVSLPLIIGLIWTASLLPILGQRLGLYNMVVLSTIVGGGIDAAVHLYHSLNEPGVDPRVATFRTGLAVSVASLTTMVGFAGMMAADHGGLSSIGRLATVGISATLAAALLFVPSGFYLLRWAKKDTRVIATKD